jgi:EAL domain-containing protein (putative c-di-GMP-specific phosphodiesterase class I)
MEIVNKLRQAIENKDFILHYQPVVDCRGRIVAAEALVRWIDRQTGHFIMPLEFINIAEETGLIIPLGDWILRAACLQQKVWSGQGFDFRISVNLSPRQFRQPNLAEKVLTVIEETGIYPGNLDIEITEGCVMEDPEPNIGKMRQLVSKGVILSIDDFGTGYSSLSYLQKFPVKNLKIDRSFINGMDKDHNAELLVRTIVSLAHSLKMHAIAEGVETVGQADLLTSLGCDCMQGYYFAKPLHPDSLLEMIKSSGSLKQDQFRIS